MKYKKILAAILIAIITTTNVSAKSVNYSTVGAAKVRCTCYLPTGNPTASGVYPYEGIIASNKEHLGQIAALYTEDMEFIGYFESKDTGGHKALKNGTRIDVYRDSEASYKKWVKDYGDYVYIQWIESEGE
jgi:3D (Asp-Asp-Asp) domain-containing protein